MIANTTAHLSACRKIAEKESSMLGISIRPVSYPPSIMRTMTTSRIKNGMSRIAQNTFQTVAKTTPNDGPFSCDTGTSDDLAVRQDQEDNAERSENRADHD